LTVLQRWLAGGVAGVLLCLVPVSILVLALRPVPIQPAAATAVVATARAVLYKEPTPRSSIATLVQGERVNVLRIPARNQAWVLVQFAGHSVLRPGYMRAVSLAGWDSADPDKKLALIRLFRSGDSATDDAIREETGKLQQLADRFPGTRAAQEAQVEMAGLDLSVVRRMKNAGEPATAWLDRIESARSHMEAAKGEPSVSSSVDDLQRQIEGLLADASSLGPSPIQPQPLPNSESEGSPPRKPISALSKRVKKRIEELLSQAEDLFKQQPRSLAGCGKRVFQGRKQPNLQCRPT
jgi:hypothetical protein